MQKRIVITGMGVISPIGIGKEEFCRSLEEGKSGIKPITLFDVSKYKVQVAGEVTDFDAKTLLGPKGLRDLDRATKLLLGSAKLALEDARMEVNEQNSKNVGVCVGTTMGNLHSISQFNQESFINGPRSTNPSTFPNTVGNSPASHVGIRFNIRGFNATISTGMCSFLDALDYACDFINMERIKTVLVGGVEDFSIETFLGCLKLNYLSGSNGSTNAPLSCPFDQRRNGIVLSEGATMFVIEDLEVALKRNVPIWGEILGIGSCFSPGKYYKFDPNGEGMVRAIKLALSSAKLKEEDIHCIFANANSTKDADRIEMKAIKKVFGKRADDIFITAVKSLVGETFSASGGISLAAALLAMEKKFIPPTVNCSQKDQECFLGNIVNKKISRDVSCIMVNTFSPNGANSVTIIKKYGNHN